MLSSLLHAQDGTSVVHDPSAATPLEPTPSAASRTDQGPGYRIGRDDVLGVSVLHAPELTVTVRVTEHGDISLPLLGAVPAAGLTALELETALETRLRDRYIREPDVTVQVTELQSQPVSVVAVAASLVVVALAVATHRTVQLSNWRDAAPRIGSGWAADHGERLLGVRFDGDTLVLIVEGSTDGAGDGERTELLRGEVPSGTPVVVNRIAGRRASIGEVAD